MGRSWCHGAMIRLLVVRCKSLSSIIDNVIFLHPCSFEKWCIARFIHVFQVKINTTRVNTLRPKQNGRRFADDTFKRIFLNENVRISIKISLKFVPKGPINNIPALVQIMAWRRSGGKSLSEPMMVSLLTHIWVTRPQWVKYSAVNGDAAWNGSAFLGVVN